MSNSRCIARLRTTCRLINGCLGDASGGNSELFSRQDLVEAQWRIVQPVLGNVTPFYAYRPGTWGPQEAHQLIGSDGPWMDPAVAKELIDSLSTRHR